MKRLILCSLLLLCCLSPQSRADEPKVYSQKPEIAPTFDTTDIVETEQDKLARKLLSEGPVPTWIWGNDQDTKYTLSQTFEGNATHGRLKATCDNGMTLFLNGNKIATSDSWETPVEVDVSKYLVGGKNVISAEVTNAGGASGFLLKLVLLDEAGDSPSYVITDKEWTAQEKDGDPVPVKTHAKLGGGPWKDVFSATVAGGVPPNVFETLPGFQVEKLFEVPKEELGSWVCIALDGKGRILASDQGNKGLYRITPGKVGTDESTTVEKLNVQITGCQGMLYAFDSLYCSVNGGPGSGLYRLKDTTGDDQYDEMTKLHAFRGGGEHGPHALRLAPDGKSIYVIAGNHTDPPFNAGQDHEEWTKMSRIPTNWGEDLLLPRQWDANGHARGKLAPGGWIARTDPNGKFWEIVSIGYRNPYDMDFNADGELFAYDADMEWDMGSPWYRPTRVVHATNGSEFGWRSGTGKWPTYYPDTLPPVVNIGPGSPVGVAFGYGTKFPAKYQQALYLCDWTFGTMYAIHLTPEGSSYTGVKEEFLSRSPLPLTDVLIGNDGAMYFTVGGRNTQSELYRVTYQGEESTEPVDAKNEQFAELRKLRHEIEEYQQPRYMSERPTTAAKFAATYLNHPDRFIRYAATMAVASRQTGLVISQLLLSRNPDGLIAGVVALCRQDAYRANQTDLLEALEQLDFAKLTEPQKLAYLRALGLVFIRLGPPDETFQQTFIEKLDPHFPSESFDLNRELLQMLVYLDSPNVVAKAVPLLMREPVRRESDLENLIARNRGYGGSIAQMLANQPDLQQYYYAFVLRNARVGWTNNFREIYFDWFNKAREWSGGASYQKFLTNISDEAYNNATEKERLAVEAAGVRKPYVIPELPQPAGPGHDWTLAELLALEPKLIERNYENGKKMFAATRCVICHRFAGDGGATGPDLTQLAGRFNLKDLSESIVDPAKVISDQYKASTVITTGGKVHTGRVLDETDTKITLLVDPENSSKVLEIAQEEIDEIQPSPVSLMPKDLLKPLNENEVLDLLAYLLSRGDPNATVFGKK